MNEINKNSKKLTKKKIYKGGEVTNLISSLDDIKKKLKSKDLSDKERKGLEKEIKYMRKERDLKITFEQIMRDDPSWGKPRWIVIPGIRSRYKEDVNVNSNERKLFQELIKEDVKPEDIDKKDRYSILSVIGKKRSDILQSEIDRRDSEINKRDSEIDTLKTQLESSSSLNKTSLFFNKQLEDKIEELISQKKKLESEKNELIRSNQQQSLTPKSLAQRIRLFFNFSLNENNEIDFKKKENIIRGLAIFGVTSTMGVILYKITKEVFKSTFNQNPINNNHLLLQIEKPEKPPKKITNNYLENLQLELSQVYMDYQMEALLFLICMSLLYSLFYSKKPSLSRTIYNTILYGVIPNLFLSFISHSILQREQQNQELFEQIEENYQKDYQKYKNLFQQLRFSSQQNDNNILSGGQRKINPLINSCHKLLRIVYIYRPNLIKKYNTIIDRIILKIKTKKLKFSYIKVFIEKYLCILLTFAIYLILFKTNIFERIKNKFLQFNKQKIISLISKKSNKKLLINKDNKKSSKKKQED